MFGAGMHARKRARNDDPLSGRIVEMEEGLEEGVKERFSEDEFLDESPESLVDEYSEDDLIHASHAGSPDASSPGDMPPKDLTDCTQESQKE